MQVQVNHEIQLMKMHTVILLARNASFKQLGIIFVHHYLLNLTIHFVFCRLYVYF